MAEHSDESWCASMNDLGKYYLHTKCIITDIKFMMPVSNLAFFLAFFVWIFPVKLVKLYLAEQMYNVEPGRPYLPVIIEQVLGCRCVVMYSH